MTAEEMIEKWGLDLIDAEETLIAFFGHEWATEVLAKHIDDANLQDALAEWLEQNHPNESDGSLSEHGALPSFDNEWLMRDEKELEVEQYRLWIDSELQVELMRVMQEMAPSEASQFESQVEEDLDYVRLICHLALAACSRCGGYYCEDVREFAARLPGSHDRLPMIEVLVEAYHDDHNCVSERANVWQQSAGPHVEAQRRHASVHSDDEAFLRELEGLEPMPIEPTQKTDWKVTGF